MLEVQFVAVSGVQVYLASAAVACVEFLGMLIILLNSGILRLTEHLKAGMISAAKV